jgi:hypothetical protein
MISFLLRKQMAAQYGRHRFVSPVKMQVSHVRARLFPTCSFIMRDYFAVNRHHCHELHES